MALLSNSDFVKLCEELAREKNLKVTFTESGKGAVLAGVGAFFGGLLGGPVGLAVGGSAGAFYGAYRSHGKFKSLTEVILYDLTDEQKTELGNRLMRVLSNIQAQDVAMLLTILATNSSLEQLVLKEIGIFLMKELNVMLYNTALT